MAGLRSLLKRLRPRAEHPSDEEKANDRAWDARTHRMLDGKGLGPTGAVMDFESDSRRAR